MGSSAGRRPTRRPGDRSRSGSAGRAADRSATRPATRRRTSGAARSVVESLARATGGGDAQDRAARRRITGRAAVLLAVFVLLVVGLAYPLREYIAQRGRIADLQQQERKQRADIARLQRQYERWQDPAYIEQQARLRLHYAKPGEITYVVIDGGGSSKSGHGHEAAKSPSWYDRLWTSMRVADRPGK